VQPKSFPICFIENETFSIDFSQGRPELLVRYSSPLTYRFQFAQCPDG